MQRHSILPTLFFLMVGVAVVSLPVLAQVTVEGSIEPAVQRAPFLPPAAPPPPAPVAAADPAPAAKSPVPAAGGGEPEPCCEELETVPGLAAMRLARDDARGRK